MASMIRTMRRRIQRANGIVTPKSKPKPPTRTQRRHAKQARRARKGTK